MQNSPIDLDRLCRDLGSYLFNCNGVPNVSKTEAFMSHEHRDEIAAPRELLLRYPDINIHVASETVAVLKNKAKTGVASDVVSSFLQNFRKTFLIHETFNIYRVGDCLPVDGLWMIRLEHDSPDVMFRSRVTFGFAKPGLFCFLPEATGRFLLKHSVDLARMLDAKYVIVSPPSRMHLVFREDVEEVRRRLKPLGVVPVMAVNNLRAEDVAGKVVLSDEFRALPEGFAVLPKIIPSVQDVETLL